jgi:leucyl aminopeptidase
LAKIKALPRSLKSKTPGLAVVFCLENQSLEGPYISEAVKTAASAEKFKASKDKTLYLPGHPRVLLYGLGRLAELDLELMRRAASAAARKARELKSAEASLVLPQDQPKGITEAELAKAAAEGIWLGLYKFSAYKSKPKDGEESRDPAQFTILCSNESRSAAAAKAIDEAREVCGAVCMVRDMVNTPPNDFNPSIAARRATRIARQGKNIRVKIFKAAQIKAMGMGGLSAVGQGSRNPPHLVHLHYRPARSRKTVALVGKGVTYDTGGLSMKRPLSMFGMKADMGGAAATLGAFIVLAKCGCPFDLSLVLCIAENAVGPKACKPDDVLRMHSGLSVEINNTDAEGRLLLADGVSWAARKLGARIVIDAATLTGAQSIATGKLHAAVIASDAELESLLVQAGRESGDLVHPLPFVPEFFRGEFNSPIADMRNSVSNRSNAQSSCAAQFIFEHLPGGVRWAHVDLAGPATLGDRGTGFGVALLSQTIRTMRGLEEPAGSGKRSRS